MHILLTRLITRYRELVVILKKRQSKTQYSRLENSGKILYFYGTVRGILVLGFIYIYIYITLEDIKSCRK